MRKGKILVFYRFSKKKNKPNDLIITDEDEDVNPDDPQPIPLV
jgi:hypothetical protein